MSFKYLNCSFGFAKYENLQNEMQINHNTIQVTWII